MPVVELSLATSRDGATSVVVSFCCRSVPLLCRSMQSFWVVDVGMGLRGPDKSERMQWDSAAEAHDNRPCGFACLAVAVDTLPWDAFATYHLSTVFVSFAIVFQF